MHGQHCSHLLGRWVGIPAEELGTSSLLWQSLQAQQCSFYAALELSVQRKSEKICCLRALLAVTSPLQSFCNLAVILRYTLCKVMYISPLSDPASLRAHLREMILGVQIQAEALAHLQSLLIGPERGPNGPFVSFAVPRPGYL